jgi:hypothetical protein
MGTWAYVAAAIGILSVLSGCAATSGDRLEAIVATNGTVSLRSSGRELAAVRAAVQLDGREVLQSAALPAYDDPANVPPLRRASIEAPNVPRILVQTRAVPAGGGVQLSYEVTPTADVPAGAIFLSIELPASQWQGGRAAAGERKGPIPLDFSGESVVFSASASSLELSGRNAHRLEITAPQPLRITVVDGRKWQPRFTLRLGPTNAIRWAAGQTRTFAIALAAQSPMALVFDEPVTIAAGDEWVPFTPAFDIQSGSALDFSSMGLLDAPAGKHGWLRAVGGHFEFANAPGRPVRFYGVNFCYGAMYLDHAQTEQLADRLARTGYNTVRIHHHERDLVNLDAPDSLTFRPEQLDRLDYFVAAMKKRGIYVTTDLYVSRPIKAGEIFPGAAGQIGGTQYKLLVQLHDGALNNLQEFSRRLLTHVNPYTGLAWKDDPAICAISLINEGMILNFCGNHDDYTRPVYQAAFNRWLLKTYGDRAGLAKAWGNELKADQDPAQGSVPLPATFGTDPPGLDLARFASQTQAEFFLRMKRFLREELGCQALLSDMNGWTDIPQSHYARGLFDYVDAHFYWDHPLYPASPRRLPSIGWSGGGSAVAAGGAGPRERAMLRIYERPYTITEYNYVGPNRYRAESGLLIGAFASIQDWSGVWRYAYASHRRDASIVFQPLPLTYFDLMCDPLNQATERAAICLYLRGDVTPATSRVAMTTTRDELIRTPRINRLVPDLCELGWTTQLGVTMRDLPPAQPAPDLLLPFTPGSLAPPPNLLEIDALSARAVRPVLAELRSRGLLPPDNPTDPERGLFVSHNGQVRIDSDSATFTVDTPRTAGLFRRDPGAARAGPLAVTLEGSGGAVWVSALDGRDVSQSRRLLLIHLTDLQNTATRFGDRQRTWLEDWGRLPYLVRAGTAAVRLNSAQAHAIKVWALDATGRRLATVHTTATGATLTFTANTRGPSGACFYYELAAE